MGRRLLAAAAAVGLALGCGDDGGGDGATTGGASDGGTGGGSSDGGSSATGGGSSDGGSSATGGGSGTGGALPPDNDDCSRARGRLFGDDHPWNQAVDGAPLDVESSAIISYLQANHTGFGRFQIDGPSDAPEDIYGIVLLEASASTPRESFTPTDDFYEPDCDPAPIPVPPGGAIEAEAGFSCDGDGDCHHIVIDRESCVLYEMWRANRSGPGAFEGGCHAVWDLTAPYVPTLRGDCCTSADAAGLPIAAHMFTADDIAAGEIRHAIRFILPNELMRERIYVRPATHSTGATSGGADAPPYGARMRLRADFDASGLSTGAQVVAQALQTYGMILSDGGNLTFTAAGDRFTTAKWRDVDLGARDLVGLEWTDFEVVELGERFVWDESCSCEREPVTD